MKISPTVINSVIQPASFIPRIVRSDKNQSEFKLTLDGYLSRTINKTRIDTGHNMRAKYPTLLRRVEQKFGVPPHVILAFWGLESNYGANKAGYKLSDAFLTLIYDGRRETFFKSQLYSLMKMADKNRLAVDDINGSWAGAMGHFQFIPTTLEKYGTDGNGDGRIDIIHNISDAMFSAGNYLSKLGWDKNERIVRRVEIPIDFDPALLDGKTQKKLSDWTALGVVGVPNADMTAGLVADANAIAEMKCETVATPMNPSNPLYVPGAVVTTETKCPMVAAYLAYPNFYRIKKWNNSNWYAIAIATLADELK
jgi:membrane-bound lytic murein transglycosylase B